MQTISLVTINLTVSLHERNDVKSLLTDGFDQWECIDTERILERRTLGNTRENWIPVQLTDSNDINCGEANAEKQELLEEYTQ